MHCGKCGNSLEKLQAAPPLDYSKPKSYTPRFLADKITEKVSKRLGEDGVIELLLRKLVWGGMGKGLTDCEDCHWIKLTGREKSAINRHDEFFLVIVAYQILTIMQDFIW